MHVLCLLTPVIVAQESLTTKMTVQVKGVWQKIQQFVDNATDGVNMICFSQGLFNCTYDLVIASCAHSIVSNS